MGKGFLRLKDNDARLPGIVLAAGGILTLFMGISAYRSAGLPENQILKNRSESYEEELVAFVGDEKVEIALEIEVQKLSEEEVLLQLDQAERALDQILLMENEGFEYITSDLYFADMVEGTIVSVEWAERLLEYFEYDGSIRRNTALKEPVEKELSAILCCQDQSRDYKRILTIIPQEYSKEEKLLQIIEKENEASKEEAYMILPESCEGEKIHWRRKIDTSFVYIGFMTLVAFICLKKGQRIDREKEKKLKYEAMEQDYPVIVSKFAMLLSTGMSIRNAWERITALERAKGFKRLTYQEMEQSARDLQKGMSEITVYEEFGNRTGLICYKKLMALFVSHKKRGGIHLIETMNQEMLSAWEEQRRRARAQGEKIGTKLLMPMMGMLLVVFLIILIPAFLSFK